MTKTSFTYKDSGVDIKAGEELVESIKDIVFEKKLLADDGLFIIEHSKQIDLSEFKHFQNAKSYGSSSFSYFTKI